MKPGTPNVLLPPVQPALVLELERCSDAVGVRCPAPPLDLIAFPALLPRTWQLIDGNADCLHKH